MSSSGPIIDLCWSKNSKYILLAVSCNSFLIDIAKRETQKQEGAPTCIIKGVAFDPLLKYIAMFGNDARLLIYKQKKTKKINKPFEYFNKRALNRMNYKEAEDSKGTAMMIEVDQGEKVSRSFKMFMDDERNISSFYKRMDWSPDANLLLVPGGQFQETPESKIIASAYIFTRFNLKEPSLVIPTNGKPSIIGRFCQKLLKKGPNETSLFDFPYKILYALATKTTVVVYSTTSMTPLYIIGNIHYESLTDISWGGSQFIGISSADGYCSFVCFGPEIATEELERKGTRN